MQFASQGCPGERIQSLPNGHRLVYTIRTSHLDLEPALGGILADHYRAPRLPSWLTASRKSWRSVYLQATLRKASDDCPFPLDARAQK